MLITGIFIIIYQEVNRLNIFNYFRESADFIIEPVIVGIVIYEA
jgi:hypothetical protein